MKVRSDFYKLLDTTEDEFNALTVINQAVEDAKAKETWEGCI